MAFLTVVFLLFLLPTVAVVFGAANSLAVQVPGYLGIYYGDLSQVNNITNSSASSVAAQAVTIFSQFDVLVFADVSPDDPTGMSNAITIVQQLVQQGKEVYGYIDLGVTTTNLSVAQMQAAVNKWLSIGVTGIFWDDVGYDYGTTRERQVEMFNYTHLNNLTIFANAWEPDDVFSGSDVLLGPRDIYLLEDYLTDGNGTYRNILQWQIKADACVAYAAQFGVRMATLSYSEVTSDFASTSTEFNFTFVGTAMYNFDFFQTTSQTVSSDTNILYFYGRPSSNYGSTWETDNVTQVNATHFYRQTNTYTLTLDGDGMSYGLGAIVANEGHKSIQRAENLFVLLFLNLAWLVL